MLPASATSFGDGLTMPRLVTDCDYPQAPYFAPELHSLCVPPFVTECDTAFMDDKNGGPNYLRAWREYRKMTQERLAELVGTNANMIQYLETGERGLSSKWLRRLAPHLDTTPGLLLEHDPNELDDDVVDIWVHGNQRQRQQIAEIARTLVKTGTTD